MKEALLLNVADVIDIVVPYAGAERLAAVWAAEEETVDFRREHEAAARCTTAFAAVELKRCLSRTLPGVTVRIAAREPSGGCFVALRIADIRSLSESFTMERRGDGVAITGDGRTGALYGAYELLRLQGWRWCAPGDAGEIAPEPTDRLVVPADELTGKPSMAAGRGFDFEYVSMESESFFLWMARNRLNVAAWRPATGAFCRKLGMQFKAGGHIFEGILDPDRILADGGTIWERHPEWYGLPENGVRRKEDAQRIQFCVSRPDLLEFLGAELVARLAGRWREADRVDLWGFDTWGHSCMCADCRRIGGSADRLLHFASAMRAAVDAATARGEVGHPVRLIVCAYEGTDTLSGPQGPVPYNLTAAGDMVVFYPINRCYEHDFADSDCPDNARYNEALRSWLAHGDKLAVVVGEYYNVSKFEDLPLLFASRMARDIPAYSRMGASGMTYMHVPFVNWGMRTLTQLLYAQLSWDADTDVEAFMRDYFAGWYGPHADAMREAYAWIEVAWRAIADWRAWKKDSVLSLLLAWDGGKPGEPLRPGGHFRGSADEAVKAGRASLELLERAMERIHGALDADRAFAGSRREPSGWKVALNPVEAGRQALGELRYELRLGEDRRLLQYGIDTMRLMTETAAYYTAFYDGDQGRADAAWAEIERTAERMDGYFLPVNYEHPGAGLISKDALTRSQLRELLRRCRMRRAAVAE